MGAMEADSRSLEIRSEDMNLNGAHVMGIW